MADRFELHLTATAQRLIVGAVIVAMGTSCSSPSREEAEPHRRVEAIPAEPLTGAAHATALTEHARRCEPSESAPDPASCLAACDLNHSNSCANLGIASLETDRTQAEHLLRRACRGGSGTGCEALAEVVKDASEAKLSYEQARRYHQIHCEQGYARSCAQLAALFRTQNGGPANLGVAHTFAERACALGHEQSCRAQR